MIRLKALQIEAIGIKYNDVWLRIGMVFLGTHFIVSHDETENFIDLLQIKGYHIAMLYNLPIALVLISVVFYVNKRLDKNLPWISRYSFRIPAQVLLGICLPAILTFIMAAIYFKIRGINIFETTYFRKDYALLLILISFLNLYYVAQFFIRFTFKLIKAKVNIEAEAKDEFKVEADVKVDEAEIIAYYHHIDRYNFSFSFSGEKVLLNGSMDALFKKLDPHWYFRVRDGFIVHRDFISSYHRSSSRRGCIILQEFYGDRLELTKDRILEKIKEVFIAQRHYMDFKVWINE